MTVQHIVLFSFPRELSAEEAADMRAMVASWPKEIGLMTRCRFGTDLTGARTRGYPYLLYTEFPSVEVLKEYRRTRCTSSSSPGSSNVTAPRWPLTTTWTARPS